MKNIVIIGGGTGTFTVLSGLRKYPSSNSVIVSSADDGGSTGELRKELGIFPPGDIRQCLVGLSNTDPLTQKLFNYRFEKGQLAGHAVGNLILAALEQISGDIDTAIFQAGKMLNIHGQVLPVTKFATVLTAVYNDGRKVVGEHNIDDPKKFNRSGIKELKLSPSGSANPKALAAIKNADAIIFGPGDLYTSILPNLLVKGVKEAVNKSAAKKILVANIMTKDGQTNGFKVSYLVEELCRYLDCGKRKLAVDTVIFNTKKPDVKMAAAYKKQKADFLEPDSATIKKMGIQIIAASLVSNFIYRRPNGDKLTRSFLRHDSDKTAKIIWQLINK